MQVAVSSAVTRRSHVSTDVWDRGASNYFAYLLALLGVVSGATLRDLEVGVARNRPTVLLLLASASSVSLCHFAYLSCASADPGLQGRPGVGFSGVACTKTAYLPRSSEYPPLRGRLTRPWGSGGRISVQCCRPRRGSR